MKLFPIAPLYSNLQTLLRNARWTLGLIWSTDKKSVSGIIIGNIIQGITPVGLAIAARGVVNAVVDIIERDSSGFQILFIWLGVGLVLTLLEALSRFLIELCSRLLQDMMNLRVSSDILDHASELELGYFEDPSFQDVMERARQNTSINLMEFITNTINAFTNIIQSVSLIGLLFFIDPLIVVLMFPVAIPYLFYQWRLSKIRFRIEHSRATKHRWTQYFIDQLTRHEFVPEVKILGLAPMLKKKFRSLMFEFLKQDRGLYIHKFVVDTIFALLSTTAAYFVFYRVSMGAIGGGVTVGDVAIFGGAAIRLRISIENGIMGLTRAMERTLFISNLLEFFNIKPTMDEKKGVFLEGPCKGKIEMKGVTFTYPGSSNPALKNVFFRIDPGETVALVGKNGSGKTTLAKMIARFYDPDEGEVLMDDRDIKLLSLDSLHSNLSLVFQNFGRYEASVRDNIAYGDWMRLLDKPREVEHIAGLLGLHEMIKGMPQGYLTMLGRTFGEYTLSGGQWQEIALARAFARGGSVIILDEPTSNLDAMAEYNLFSRFKDICEDRTAILISHRFSTVSMADRILVLEKGELVEQGTHEELVKREGHYFELYSLHRRQMEGDISESMD